MGTYHPGVASDPESLALAADFPSATREQWRALVAAVLGRSDVAGDPEDALTSTTYDGIRIRPLYTAEEAPGVDLDGLPGQPPFVRGGTALLLSCVLGLFLLGAVHSGAEPKHLTRGAATFAASGVDSPHWWRTAPDDAAAPGADRLATTRAGTGVAATARRPCQQPQRTPHVRGPPASSTA